jgi:aminopeptidase N
MHIPIAFGLVGPDGQDLSYRSSGGAPVSSGVIHLRKGSERVVFEGVRAQPVPSLFREFSAPIHLRSDLTTEDKLFLVGRDPDPFNRWEAAQQVALAMLTSATADLREGRVPSFDPRLGEELERLAQNDELDAAFRALALSLPSETEIAQAIGHDIDPDHIHAARRALQCDLGRQIGRSVMEAAERAAPAAEYSPDAENAGRRSLAHAGWNLLVAGEWIDGSDLLRRYDAARNLTDRLAALRLIVHYQLDTADAALDRFYQAYRDNALVLDKWLAVQAMIPSHAACERVQALTKHPVFSLKNPNRIYSLIRSFAAGNPVGFNRPDGTGYRFVAGLIGEIDGHNPSVAARIATAYRSWRLLEPKRRGEAESALRQLRESRTLSRDLDDILGRTLED